MQPVWNLSFRYWMLTVVILLFALAFWYLREIFPPLIIAALLAYLINPIVDFLERKSRIPRSVSLSFVTVLFVGALAGLPALLWPWLLIQLEALSVEYQNIMLALDAFLNQPVNIFFFKIDLGNLFPEIQALPSEGIPLLAQSAFELLESLTTNALWLLVILVTTYSLVKDWDHLRESLINLVPVPFQPDIRRIHKEIVMVWSGYLRGNLALMIIVGVIFTIAWLILGIPGAVVLGILAGLLTIIPDLGPAIAAGVAMLVALVEGSIRLDVSNFWFMVLVFAVYMVLINIKNLFIRPRLFARSVHMHEGLVFVAIIVAVIQLGILGALVVVPVLASLGVIGRYVWRRILGVAPFPSQEVLKPDQNADIVPQI